MPIASVSGVPWEAIGAISSLPQAYIGKFGPAATAAWQFHNSDVPLWYPSFKDGDNTLLFVNNPSSVRTIRNLQLGNPDVLLKEFNHSAFNQVYSEGNFLYLGDYGGYIEIIDTTGEWSSVTVGAGYHPNRGLSKPEWPYVYFSDSGGFTGMEVLDKSSHSVSYALQGTGALMGQCIIGDSLYMAEYYYTNNLTIYKLDGASASLSLSRTFTGMDAYSGQAFHYLLTDGTRLWAVGSNIDFILELDPVDLSTIGTYTLPRAVNSDAAYFNGKIYFMPSDGNLMYAFDVNTHVTTSEALGDPSMRLYSFSREYQKGLVFSYAESATPYGYAKKV